jgi:hypothetical protein
MNTDEAFEKFMATEYAHLSKEYSDMQIFSMKEAFMAGAESQEEVIHSLTKKNLETFTHGQTMYLECKRRGETINNLKEDLKMCLAFIDNNIDYDDQTDEVLSRLAKKHGLDV